MGLLWLVDRALALVAYPSLYLAVLTGVLYRARRFGPLHDAARRVHVEVSVLAVIVMLAHGILGLIDAGLVLSGAVPTPAYGRWYFLAGLAVGAGGFVVLLVSVTAFLAPRRFASPWTARVVHALAYVGFAFAAVHAVAVGTDVVGLVRPALTASTAFLGYLLVLRAFTMEPDATPGNAERPH